MGVSSRAGIARVVSDLEAQGFLERKRVDGHFAITLTGEKADRSDAPLIAWLEIPHPGEVVSDFAFAEFYLPEFVLGGHDVDEIRAFRVPDDSLSDNAICQGDIALIEMRSFARDGDIVAAVVESRRALLRKIYRIGSSIELCGSTNKHERIRLAADRVKILGVFRGLIRPMT
jgi:repressor LexA